MNTETNDDKKHMSGKHINTSYAGIYLLN
jgi:hypothetical protein